MSWEWRVFWPSNEDNVTDILEVLDIKHSWSFPWAGRGAGVRARTDVYVSCTEEVGIKWRGERLVEVKVRSERDEKSGAEKWEKIISGRSARSPDLKHGMEIKQYLVSLLEKSAINNYKYQLQLNNAKETILATPMLKFETVTKQRSDSFKDECSIEHTYLTHPQSNRNYQSVCLEGNKVCIEKLLDTPTKNGQKLKDTFQTLNSVTCGYPQFVINL